LSGPGSTISKKYAEFFSLSSPENEQEELHEQSVDAALNPTTPTSGIDNFKSLFRLLDQSAIVDALG
jgi:hypothetical protein